MTRTFQTDKQELLGRLHSLKEKLLTFDQYDIDVSALIQKVETSIGNLEEETFIIAMFGAFTDGKSTILSSITRRSDIDISPEPTTDEVSIFRLEHDQIKDDFYIVDTPGLFSEHMIHSERTQKYICEANVIVYTVDPVNPLKDSHHSTIKWLLEDLGKAESTLFVINKMDEVADLDDEEDFNRSSEIKQKVVTDTIESIVNVTNKPKVICVSADPYGMGLEHWLNEEADYARLSRMDTLITELDLFIQEFKNELVRNAGISVIKDAILQSIGQLEAARDEIKKSVELSSHQLMELDQKIGAFSRDLTKKYGNIKEEILNLREDIFSVINSCTNRDDLKNKVQAKIGSECTILSERINLIIQKHTESLFHEQLNLLKNIESSLSFHSDMQSKLLKFSGQAGAKLGSKLASQSSKTLSQSILKVRDMAKLPIKFKPWEAMKWGKAVAKFGKFLQGLPALLDGISAITDMISEQKLKKERQLLLEQIEGLFKDFNSTFTRESYIDTYFPLYKSEGELREDIGQLHQTNQEILQNIEDSLQQLRKEKQTI